MPSPLPRPFLRGFAFALVVLGAAALLAALWLGSAGDRQSARRGTSQLRPIETEARSLLLVTVDTTRPDRLEPYGATTVATPHLARLASEGIVFEQASAVAPITLVAHTSILTGLDPPRHGVRNNGIHSAPEELETLAERLSDEGFRTGAFVSAAVLERRYNLDQGFEVYDDDLSAGRERHPRMVPDRPAEATVRAATAWLDQLDDESPYFLWVHLYDPHAVYSPPPPYRDTYRERLYDGEIAYMDAWIGKLLQHRRVDGQTLVSVIGDHGESLGEHGEQTHALLAYDSTLHVPWILRVPGGPEGLRVPASVGQVDLVPTVLDLLGLDSRVEDGAGQSLRPLLEGAERLDLERERALYGETWLPFYTYGWAQLRVWRQGRYKWIDGPDPELFDTRRDPHELADLAEREPGLAHDLARDLHAYLERVGDGERETELELDAQAREQLRSLGYLSVGSGDRASMDDSERPDPKAMTDVHVGLERARFLVRDWLFEAAESELRRVLDRDPTNLAAMIDLASALGEQGRFDDGIRVLERALELDPGYQRLHLLLANFEARRGRSERAFELFDWLIERDPRSLEARLQKAVFLAQAKPSDERSPGQSAQYRAEARRLLEAARRDHPDSAHLAVVHARLALVPAGRLAEAESQVRGALARDPFLALGWRQLGSILERQGRPREALDAYRQGLERSVDDPQLHARLGLLLARGIAAGEGHAADAEMHLREALRLAREPALDVRVALGAWLAERGRTEEAQAQYRLVLEERPGHPGALNNQALALYRTGRIDEALAALESLVERHPGHADARNNLAAIAIELGHYEQAENHARETLAQRPAMVEAWNNLGLALGGRGQADDAIDAYDRALELDSDYWQARFGRGLALAGLGRARPAATELETVLQHQPQRVEVHLELGQLYCDELDDLDRCRRHWNAVLRLAPGHPRADELRRRLVAAEQGSATKDESASQDGVDRQPER